MKKSFGSLYDQSESADLDDLQLERTHPKSHFCVDSVGICYSFILFLIYVAFILVYSLLTSRTPDKISRSISRVPVYVSAKNQSTFRIELKIANLHHNPSFLNFLNCSAVKMLHDTYLPTEEQELSNSNLQVYEKYQNIFYGHFLNNPIKKDEKDIYFQFNITEKHRIQDRNSRVGEYSKETFKSIIAIFPKKSIYSTEFNIFSFIFNDPDYFTVEKDPDNFIYSKHSTVNSPSLISYLTIQTNFTNFNALDFVYYYAEPITKKYFKTLLQIFVIQVLFALSINIFYSKSRINQFTRVFCIILTIFGILAINPFENYIDSHVFNHLTPNHKMSFNTTNYDNQNEASLRFGCFSFALFANCLRFFLCIQFCFICSHSFSTMFHNPNLFVTFGLIIFYCIFTLVDYKAQYYREKNLFRYSSLSNANFDLLIKEQEKKMQHISYDTSLFLPSATASQNAMIPPLRIERLRMIFVLAHFCFYLWLVKTSYEKVNDDADPCPNAENNRLKALIAFSFVPNVAAVLVHCFFVSYSILQRKIFPDVFLFSSYELCVASILLLFRGVDDDVEEDDSFQRFYKLGRHSDFGQRAFEID